MLWWIISIAVLAIIIFLVYGYVTADEEQRKIMDAELQKIDFFIPENIYANHIEGLPNVSEGVELKIVLKRDKLIFNKNQIIPLDRVFGTEVLSQREIIEKQKNMTGRMIVGGLTFGLAGGIIAGMTALGNNKKSKDVDILFIKYKDINNEEKQLVFMADKNMGRFISRKINNQIGYISQNINIPHEI